MSLREPMARSVLVVDDDRAIAHLVSTRLTIAGYKVFAARDGNEALAQLADVRPGAMVLDLSMPSLDGFGVLERMAADGGPLVPTLVLTARHGAADVQRAIALGARDYMAKPFRDRQLLMRVARLFRRQAEVATSEQTIAGVDPLLV